MRLLLVGAFPYPFWQGSQIYFQEQAIALRDAGVDVELLTYASGAPEMEGAERALDGFRHHTPRRFAAPRHLRSGPAWGKPLADLALSGALNDALASSLISQPFDAILTHNAEAALAGLRPGTGRSIPRIYCVHTLLANELSAYLETPQGLEGARTPRSLLRGWASRRLDDAGHRIDRFLARRTDGWIALTQSSGRVMRQFSNRPGARIPPPLPAIDGRRVDPEVIAFADRLELEAGEYFLYSGNLDGYQELPVLAEAAATLHAKQSERPGPQIIVASHDASDADRVAQLPGLEYRNVRSSEEMLLLLRGARANVVMRRAEGGYPIKLANAHAAGTPSIVFREREWGLTDGVDCLAASLDRPAESLARAIERLAQDANLAERLGAGARALHRAQHAPEGVAQRTLRLIEEVIASKA